MKIILNKYIQPSIHNYDMTSAAVLLQYRVLASTPTFGRLL